MNIWIWILIGIIVFTIFMFKRMGKVTGVPLLKTRIWSPDGFNYEIQFEELHPEIKKIEYVRMVLNFIANVLFLVEKKMLILVLQL